MTEARRQGQMRDNKLTALRRTVSTKREEEKWVGADKLTGSAFLPAAWLTLGGVEVWNSASIMWVTDGNAYDRARSRISPPSPHSRRGFPVSSPPESRVRSAWFVFLILRGRSRLMAPLVSHSSRSAPFHAGSGFSFFEVSPVSCRLRFLILRGPHRTTRRYLTTSHHRSHAFLLGWGYSRFLGGSATRNRGSQGGGWMRPVS